MSDVSLADRVYVELRSAIMDQRLAPGSSIVEADLAEMLGVSRTPVREALRRCELEGYLTRDDNGRLVIELPTAEMVEQLFVVRVKIEDYAVRRAATRISDAELARLDELVSEDFEALGRPRTERLAEINAEIHGTILEASRNRTLVSLMRSFRGRSHGLTSFAVGDLEDRRRFVEDHRSLVALLRDGDAVGAGGLIRSHLDHAHGLIIQGIVG
ncbi:MAG: GntR family transcriptional regulator [Thermoleophilia bacterium]|nr:GntR family transcriptional regulator [Thermoleophilia bacterium]